MLFVFRIDLNFFYRGHIELFIETWDNLSRQTLSIHHGEFNFFYQNLLKIISKYQTDQLFKPYFALAKTVSSLPRFLASHDFVLFAEQFLEYLNFSTIFSNYYLLIYKFLQLLNVLLV